MIERYKIHNFKIHGDTDLSLSNLSILTGMNGMGKSSVIQSMLMLRESFLKGEFPQTVNLRGESFQIGQSSQLVNWNTAVEPHLLRISIMQDCGCNFDFAYQYPLGDVTRLNQLPSAVFYSREELEKCSLFSGYFQYLSAFRDGPQSVYQTDTAVVDDHKQLSFKMGRGEFAVYFLSRFGDENIPIQELNFNCDEIEDLSLRTQTEAWLTAISPDIRINIEQRSTEYFLKFGYRKEGTPMKWIDALNTGFGITYVLSVLVAVLFAPKGSLVLIENPEAHIHQAAQAALMKLISRAAEHGVQIILETHSDHVINGALVALRKGELKETHLAVYYFDRNRDTMNAEAIPLAIGKNCRIKDAPQGFFDQMKMDLETLFGF